MGERAESREILQRGFGVVAVLQQAIGRVHVQLDLMRARVHPAEGPILLLEIQIVIRHNSIERSNAQGNDDEEDQTALKLKRGFSLGRNFK